jgi:transposase-like protein
VLGSRNRQLSGRAAKSAQPAAKRAIQEICNAEDKEHAARAVASFAKQYGAKYPKVVRRITDDEDDLLAFFDYPARALDPPTYDESFRIDLRHRAMP